MTTPPLMGISFLRLTAEKEQLTWSFHLYLLDGWSLGAILKEVLAVYEDFRRGHQLRLESLVPITITLCGLRGKIWRRSRCIAGGH